MAEQSETWFPGYGARFGRDASGPAEHVLGDELATRLYDNWRADWVPLISVGGVRYATCQMVASLDAHELALVLHIPDEQAQSIVKQCRRRS